jgi:hypothetical protein
MNERIKLLIEQSYDTVEYNYAPSKEFFNKQKFAQLIVKECASVLLKWKGEPFPFDEDLAASLIKQHFGVEE